MRVCAKFGRRGKKPKDPRGLDLAEILQHRVDHLKSLIDLLADFGTGQDNLAADEDQKHDLGLDHTVDETREQLRLIRAEVVMLGGQTLEANRELDVARADDVLDLEIGELGIEAKLLNDARILARRKLRVILGFRTSNNHLSTCEDQSGSLGLTDTHDNSRETLRVVLSVSRMKRNRLEIQTAIEIDRRDDVLESGRQATSVRRCARRRSRSRGSHPSTISGLSSILATVDRGTLVLGGRGRRELASGTRERQGARRGEGLRLRSVGWMRLNCLHLAPILCFESARFGSKTYFSNRPGVGDEQLNVSPSTVVRSDNS